MLILWVGGRVCFPLLLVLLYLFDISYFYCLFVMEDALLLTGNG